MAHAEYLLFGFSYHRVSRLNRWRPGGSTLGRITPGPDGVALGVKRAHHTEQIVWIDVVVEKAPDQDIDDLSRSCETLADAEFLRLYPQAELPASR